MTTERQKKARRINGARSRGPTTSDGKAVSRLNAMKHGLYCEMTVIDGENEADLVAFGKRLRADLAPVGELELMLADKIVSTSWRLRRLVGAEARLYMKDAAERNDGNMFGGYSGDKMLRLNRYETTLDRSLYKALHELQRLQAARRGDDVPPPEVVDITVSASGLDAADEVSDAVATVGSVRHIIPPG